MDAQALLRINAQEDHFLPVEIKVRMLMEQAAMRMRASAMVGERISKLDDVIRVRALLAIIREKTAATEAQQHQQDAAEAEAEATPSCSRSSSSSITSREEERGDISSSPDNTQSEECSQEPPLAEGEKVTPSAAPIDRRCSLLPSEEDLDMFTRMAVSSTKVVLFQLTQEGRVEGAKDVFDLYEGLLTTSALSQAAAEGFPEMNVDSLMSPRHSCYRRLVAARHRFLLRKLGVLLDMKEDLDILLDLAADVEVLRDSLADVDLGSPEDEEPAAKELMALQAGGAEGGGGAEPSPQCRAPISTVISARGRSATGNSAVELVMSTLRNTTWEKDAAGEDTTEGETDEDTPPLSSIIALISPSH